MACRACQIRQNRLQVFSELTEASVLAILAYSISSSCYKWVVVDQCQPFNFRSEGGCMFYCSPLAETLQVCCKIRAFNRTWITRMFYISHLAVLAELEASWLPS